MSDLWRSLEEDAFSFGTRLSDMLDVVLPTSPPALAPEVRGVLVPDSTEQICVTSTERVMSDPCLSLEEDAFSFGTGLSDMPDVVLPTSPPALAPEVRGVLVPDSTEQICVTSTERVMSDPCLSLEEDAFSFGTGLSDMPDVVLPTSPPALAPEVCLFDLSCRSSSSSSSSSSRKQIFSTASQKGGRHYPCLQAATISIMLSGSFEVNLCTSTPALTSEVQASKCIGSIC